MTFEIGFLLAMLAAMVFLFLTEKLPVDLTAFLGLTVLIFAGYVEPSEAFTGFSSPAVITMLAVFILSAGLQETGVADAIGARMYKVVGGREIPLVIVLMLVAGVLSAFMNNVAATAVLLPAVASLGRRAGVPAGRLFMPLAFGAILGGTLTLVGTPPNLLAAQVLQERGLEPFSLFDFTPFGAVLLALGVLYMVTVGRKLLPDRSTGVADSGRQDPGNVTRVQEKVFSIRVPPASALAGKSLRDARLGTALGVQVVAIIRGGKERLAPSPEDVVEAGDLLVVGGDVEDLEELLKVQGVEMREADAVDLAGAGTTVEAVVARLASKAFFVGRTLRELRFRDRYALVVTAIRRDGEELKEQIASIPLKGGDELLMLGPPEEIERIRQHPVFEVVVGGPDALAQLEQSLFLVRVPEGSGLAGRTVGASRMGELVGLTVVGLLRGGETLLAVSADDPILPGDQLLVTGEATRLLSLMQLGQVEIAREVPKSRLESRRVGVVEVVLGPRSAVAGKTLKELNFRERYGLQVLSLWQGGQNVQGDLADLKLGFGDGLLLQGPRDKIGLLAEDPDFVVLSTGAQTSRRTHRAPYAIGALLLMVGLVVSGYFPIQVAAFAAASLTVLFGALKMREAYRAVEWKAIFLVAAVLPVGIAMERTGAALLIAENVAQYAGAMGPYAVLGALMVLSSLLSQGLDGAPTVVLLAPVVIFTAEQLGMSPYPLMMGVGLAASAAFMTPFSHKANLLVMGAGGYRSMDYVKVGTPLTIVVLAILTFMIPFFFPF